MQKKSFEELKNEHPPVENEGELERTPVIFVCENIRSLYNVGSIFRTSDGICLEKIYLCGITGYPPRKEIDKVALGAAESVPWEHYKDISDVIRILKQKNIRIIALEHTNNSKPFQEFEFEFPVAVILGHEYEGITQETLEMCDDSVEIPMLGIKHSLNVATACGVLGYELLRQWNSKKKK